MGRAARMHGGWSSTLGVIAGVVGAGFASGREAAVFFAPYGGWGLTGIVLTVVLLARATRRPPGRLPAFLGWAWRLLLWVTLSATLAAGGEILRHLAGWPTWLGSVAFALLATFAPAGGRSRSWQGLTVFLLAGAILLVGVGGWVGLGAATAGAVAPETPTGGWPYLPGIGDAGVVQGGEGWPPNRSYPAAGDGALVVPGTPRGEGGAGLVWAALLSSLLYASYTSALVVGGLGSGSYRQIPGLASGVVGLLLIVMVGALRRSAFALEAPLPMVVVAAAAGRGAGMTYAGLLGLAAANAAVANAQALGESLSPSEGGALGSRAIVVALAWVAGLIGFHRLVGIVYPLLGWAWLPALFWLSGPRTCPGRGQAL